VRIGDLEVRQDGRRWQVAVRGADGVSKFFSFPPGLLPFWDKRIDLWSRRARKEFDKQFDGSQLVAWLERQLVNLSDPYVLKIPADASERAPWEAFHACFASEDRAKFVPLRMTDTNPPWASGEFNERMKVLLLIGHPGFDNAFVPDLVRGHIEKVFDELDFASKACIEEEPLKCAPLVGEKDIEAAAVLAGVYRPNVVIFYGHGSQENGPEILCGPPSAGWMKLSDVVDSIFQDPHCRPYHWIFWACSLAEETTQPNLRLDGPQIFQALKARGAASILAMRARIRVDYSEVMLRALFQALAAGRPLEMAAAFARSAACARANSDGRIDFAAPAVWSLNAPLDRIIWRDRDATAVTTWDILPLLSVEDEFQELSMGAVEFDQRAVAAARSWSACARVFVDVEGNDLKGGGEAAALFFETAAAARHYHGRPAIPILLRQGRTVDDKLRRWAQAAHRRLDPRTGASEIAAAVQAVKEQGLAGLSQLLALPQALVLLSEPPDVEETWRVFSEAPPGTTIVVAGTTMPDKAADWTLDKLVVEDDRMDGDITSLLQAARAAAPMSAAMLALLRRPVSLQDVAEFSGEGTAQLDKLKPLTVPVSSRKVLAETARRGILQDLEDEEAKTARLRCIDLLQKGGLNRHFGKLLEIARLLVDGEDWKRSAKFLNTAYETWGGNWDLRQWLQLSDLASVAPMLDELDDGVVLGIAHACVSVQQTSLGRSILEGRNFSDDFDEARRRALLHEAYKADASSPANRSRMRKCAQEAVEFVKRGLIRDPENKGAQIDLIGYRLNVARIAQYFDRDQAKAYEIYVQILSDIHDRANEDAVVGRIAAAAYRNAAECQFDNQPIPLSEVHAQKAVEAVDEGLRIARSHGLTDVESELLYTSARLLEARKDPIGARGRLEEAATTASRVSYPLVAAIARDRRYWLQVQAGDAPFRLVDVNPNIRALSLLEWHLWAARVSIKSRLRAARRLLAGGQADDQPRGLELLQGARRIIRERKLHSGDTDFLRAARTYAGLKLYLGSNGDEAWNEFLAYAGSAGWLEKRGTPDAQTLWEEID
jgi:hypothetical protein